MRSVLSLLCREPYRIFFPMAVFFGIAGTGHWFLYGMGLEDTYSGYFHAALQTWLYMGFFAAGFLMTAVPRFSATESSTPLETVFMLVSGILVFILLISRAWTAAASVYWVWLAGLFVFILRRFLRKGIEIKPPVEFVWIPVAFLHGFTGILLILLSQGNLIEAHLLIIGRAMVEQGFLLCLVSGVGGFLGSRLLGTHELPSPEKLRMAGYHASKLGVNAILAILLFVTFWAQPTTEYSVASFLRAVIVTAALVFNKALSRPKIKGLFQRLLALSFWMVVLGLWAMALRPLYRVAALHLLFMSGFGLMTFLIATMVTLSHAGQGDRLKKPLWVLIALAFCIFSSLLIRLAAQVFPELYFRLLGAASSLWMVACVAWLVFAMPYLLRAGSENEEDCKR